MDYRRLSNFFRGRTLQVSEQMTLDEVTETLEDAEPVGAVLSSNSGRERLTPSKALERLKESVEELSSLNYERYDSNMDALHYVDSSDNVSLKIRQIKF